MARSYFDIHRLPASSLLRLGGKALTNQFVPTVTRATTTGAIFRLTTAKQHLLSIHYHHEGGQNHWYIIPSSERQNLQRILNQYNTAVCLDHGQIVIDPSVLDKYHVRYHRIIQNPNEFIILSAAALSQSFTTSANWGESIVFALPSWIEKAHHLGSNLRCRCSIPYNQLSPMIDMSLFESNHLYQFITSYLSIKSNDQSSDQIGTYIHTVVI